jgi:branched-chain amino acid transport system substrate-binding protein
MIIIASFTYFRLKDNTPYKIGVLIPLTGPLAMNLDTTLNWTLEKINNEGGIAGKQIELIYEDSNTEDIKEKAMRFINDKEIDIVIGPATSDNSFELAPLFIKNKKILISPMSTSADLFRAFGKKKFYWRTVQGDVAQIKTILHILKLKGVKNISLLYEDTAYGKTFLDWVPFFSIEMDINLLKTEKYERGSNRIKNKVYQILEDNPEYIITVGLADDMTNIKKILDEIKSNTKLFLTDAAESPELINLLKENAEDLEGTSPGMDPNSGFIEEYNKEFGIYPNSFAASAHDALLLAVYSLARHHHKNGWEWIEDSIKTVVEGRGEKTKWNEYKKTIDLILKEKRPDISGASGSLQLNLLFFYIRSI